MTRDAEQRQRPIAEVDRGPRPDPVGDLKGGTPESLHEAQVLVEAEREAPVVQLAPQRRQVGQPDLLEPGEVADVVKVQV